MRLSIYICFVFLFCSGFTPVPDPDYFSSPVKIPILLSGNFGELRANHFHAGIDIKTQGRTGVQIYAPADGYVSRISVSPSGYGLSIYINHPNGTTTVYGHLQKLRPDLATYLKSIQYDNENFTNDIVVPEEIFPVQKDELIAYSGNSGSSGGPHLHFEIRDIETERPVNPLFYNFNIKDFTPPVIQSVVVYPLSDDAHVSGKSTSRRIETVSTNGTYRLKENPTISVYGEIGFGIQTTDYLDGSQNVCGVYEIELSVDANLIYTFMADKLDFEENRYLNSHIDYQQYRKYGRQLHKTWVEPGNKLRNYPFLENFGKVTFADDTAHTIKFVVKDINGNSSTLEFKVTSRQENISKPEQAGFAMAFNDTNIIRQNGFETIFKPGTFYSDFVFDFQELPAMAGCHSPVFRLHNTEVPVHQYFDLKINAASLPERLQSKALIAVVNESTGSKSSVGGKFEDGWVKASIRQLGSFAIVIDSVAPVITPMNIQNRTTITDKNKISFKISDNFSGISSYRGEIDGQWVLFEYDAKNSLLEYYFDPEYLELNKQHQLKLVVTDSKDNSKSYEASFYR